MQRLIEADLRKVTGEISRLIGLPSQWNGQVVIVPEQDRAFGGKTFACLIRIRADVAASELRWPTLLHEAFHGFSVGRNPDASLAYTGYEEGVVEQLQRLFRGEPLEVLGVTVDARAFVDRDENNAYNDYVSALEAMREALQEDAKPFYIALLSTPLEQRWAVLRDQAQQTPSWPDARFRQRWRDWDRTLRGDVQ